MSYFISSLKKYIGKFVCKMLLPFIHGEVDCIENSVNEARRFLVGISPNPNKSCLRNDKTKSTQEYDLQVIIPAYKTAQYIERCIDSVLALPTSRRIIVTIVNDGSPDNTAEILRKYEEESRVEVITQENRGFSGARNRALDDIKARYVTFLDSDDEFLRGGVKIDELLQFADDNDIDILECSHVIFNDKTDLQTIRHENVISTKANGLLFGVPWGKIFKSELFSCIHFPEGYWFEDTVMAFVIFPMARKVATSSQLLYHYRMNSEGITSKSRGNVKSLDTYWITERLLADRALLGLRNDEMFAEVMLQQVRMNYNRIRNLERTDIDRAVFVLTANLWEKYFHNIKINVPLAKALVNRDFLQYRLVLELNK